MGCSGITGRGSEWAARLQTLWHQRPELLSNFCLRLCLSSKSTLCQKSLLFFLLSNRVIISLLRLLSLISLFPRWLPSFASSIILSSLLLDLYSPPTTIIPHPKSLLLLLTARGALLSRVCVWLCDITKHRGRRLDCHWWGVLMCWVPNNWYDDGRWEAGIRLIWSQRGEGNGESGRKTIRKRGKQVVG